MLKWCKDLRIGEGVKRADKIRRKLNHGKIVPDHTFCALL